MRSFKDLREKTTNESWGDKMPKSERPGWVKDPKTGKWVKPTQVKKEAVEEKTLTPAEKKKREEIAKAMERDNPGMDMKKKMAIATWQAKKVAEVTISPLQKIRMDKEKADRNKDDKDKPQSKRMTDKQYAGYKVKMKEESELEEGLYHVEYGRSGKLTHQVVAKDAKDAHQKAMAHLKKKNPKLAHPDYADTFHKPSITHIKGNEPRADKYKTEATEIDEISLSHLSNTIAKSTGTKNVKTAMKPGEVKKGLDDLKKRLATLGQEPKMAKEAYEEEPASPDEKSMAMRQAKFIQYVGDEIMEHLEQDGDFPEWMQNKLSELHQKAKDMHSTMAGSYEDDKEEMDEAVRKGAPKMQGDFLKKERERNRAHDAAMGRTPTGRKKPVRTMTSTQRSLAKLRNENVMSADKKPEKFVKPDGKVGIRMVRVDKKVVDKDA